MKRERWENRVTLTGEAVREPDFSHSRGGEDFFTFPLRCRRLSGTEDVLNVVVSRTVLEKTDIRAGCRLSLEGEVRSYNNRSGSGSRLVVTVRAVRVAPARGDGDGNLVRLTGNLCRRPVYRHTPLGREITDLLLAVNRRSGRADFLPCVTWGGMARRAACWETGERVRLWGRLQSRPYLKTLNGTAVERIAYEVSAMKIERIPAEPGGNETVKI